MYAPVIAQQDSATMFVSCDMGGIYLSRDGGQHWRMQDGRAMLQPSIGEQEGSDLKHLVAFDFGDAGAAYAVGPGRPLSVYDLTADRWTPLALSGDEQLLRQMAEFATVLAVCRTADGTDGARPPIILGLDGPRAASDRGWPDLAGILVRPDGTVTPVQLADDSTPLAGRAVAIVAIPKSDGSLDVLLTTRMGLYHASGAYLTQFTAVGTGLALSEGLELFDLCAGAGADQPRLYATIVQTSSDGSAGGVYTTTDPGGNGWTSAMGTGDASLPTSSPGGALSYRLLATHEADPMTVYVAAWDPDPDLYRRLYRSRDGGASWEHVLNVSLDPARNPADAQCNLEQGGGWAELEPFNPDFGGPARGLAASREVVGIVAFTNQSSVYVSQDGADSWQERYTSPAGPTGQNHSIGLEVTTAWNYAIHPTPRTDAGDHYICYTDIVGAHSSDGGTTWRSIHPSARDGSPYNTIYELAMAADPACAGMLWAAAARQHDLPYAPVTESGGGIVFSRDYGDSWEDRSTNLPTDPPAVSVVLDPRPLDPDHPQDSRRLWAALYGDGVWLSNDSGASWQLSGLEGEQAYRLQRHRDGSLYCSVAPNGGGADGRDGQLWRSSDDGATWDQLPLELPYDNQQGLTASRLLRDYATHPQDSSVLFVCTAGWWEDDNAHPGGVFKSADGGTTWQHVRMLDNVGAGDGVMPPYDPDFVSAFGAFFHPTDPRVVFVTTEHHGLWFSDDAGTLGDAGTGSTWTEVTEIPFLHCHRISFDASAGSAYVTTFGGGVWRLSPLPT